VSEVYRNFICPDCGHDVGLEDGLPISPCICMKEPDLEECEWCGDYIEQHDEAIYTDYDGAYHADCYEEAKAVWAGTGQ